MSFYSKCRISWQNKKKSSVLLPITCFNPSEKARIILDVCRVGATVPARSNMRGGTKARTLWSKLWGRSWFGTQIGSNGGNTSTISTRTASKIQSTSSSIPLNCITVLKTHWLCRESTRSNWLKIWITLFWARGRKLMIILICFRNGSTLLGKKSVLILLSWSIKRPMMLIPRPSRGGSAKCRGTSPAKCALAIVTSWLRHRYSSSSQSSSPCSSPSQLSINCTCTWGWERRSRAKSTKL